MFDWITGIVETTGYLGIALLMLAENLFPPIPSELIMPLAGFVAAKGELSPVLVVVAGVVGSVLGALPWYYLGRWLGQERMCRLAAKHGRWLTMDEKELGRAIDWFERHGRKAVFFGRLVPAVRTLISLPAGIGRMPIVPFLAYSTLGTLIWTSGLVAAGYLLEDQYDKVGQYLDAVSKIVIGLIVVTYLYRLLAAGRLGRGLKDWSARLWSDARTVYRSARDPRVPWYAKAWSLLIVGYLASPIDLIPDFIPVLGHLDDAILVPLGIWLAIRMIPRAVVEEHRASAGGADAPRQRWRVGALFIALWAIALAFVLRWVLGLVLEG